MSGINTIDIENFFSNEDNEDLKKNLMGVYSSNNFIKYINFHDVSKEKKVKYPFAIFNTDNTDRNKKPGTYWWSFLDIEPRKNLVLFDSFGFEGFKKFIIDNDLNIIDKVLYNIKKIQKKR